MARQQPMPPIVTTTTPPVPLAATYDVAAPTSAEAGIVTAQATTIRLATPQCTTSDLRPAPAPKIAPVQTCVVDSGMPKWVDVRIRAALVVSAVNPWGAWISVIRLPSVRMIRQPPAYEPAPMATPAARTTQNGGPDPGSRRPAVMRV